MIKVRSWLLRILLILGMLLSILFLYAWHMGGQYIAAAHGKPQLPPRDMAIKEVKVSGRSAWFVEKSKNTLCVLLLHGMRANRHSMLRRARFLDRLGYSSLLIDLQAHGQSPGEYITFGYRESEDVRHAVQFLRQSRICQKLVVLGTSLGGAAAVLAQPSIEADAFILEGVYGSIEEAVKNRMIKRFGELGSWLAPLMTYQIPLRLNVSLDKLRPAEAIKKITVPVYILAGDQDRRTRIQETQRIFDNAPGKKQLWIVKGARHQDLHRYAKAEYEKRLQKFLAEIASQ